MQACLVIAHANIEQVIKLSEKLSEDFLVYIHLDKKFEVSSEDLERLKATKNTYVYSVISVMWGGFTIGEAMLFLVKKALENPDVEYIHIISGVDWPVCSTDKIKEFYENNNNIYMVYELAENVKKCGEPILLWDKYYFNYDKINRRTLLGKIYHRLSIMAQTLLRVDKFKKLNITLDIYRGENWCDMPRRAAEYALNFLANNPNYYKMFKTGFCSDEAVFQTILCNCEFKDNIICDHHRFIKWEKKHGSYPAILDMEEFEEIKKGEYHFARKIDLDISGELLEKLENDR